MSETFFTKSEASDKVGRKVRLTSPVASTPKGTPGIVVKAVQQKVDEWSVQIKWGVPRPMSLIDTPEVSFIKREKPTVSEVSKSVYDRSLEEIS